MKAWVEISLGLYTCIAVKDIDTFHAIINQRNAQHEDCLKRWELIQFQETFHSVLKCKPGYFCMSNDYIRQNNQTESTCLKHTECLK